MRKIIFNLSLSTLNQERMTKSSDLRFLFNYGKMITKVR